MFNSLIEFSKKSWMVWYNVVDMKPNLEEGEGQKAEETCSESPSSNPVTIIERNGQEIQVWCPFKDVTKPERKKGDILKVLRKEAN